MKCSAAAPRGRHKWFSLADDHFGVMASGLAI